MLAGQLGEATALAMRILLAWAVCGGRAADRRDVRPHRQLPLPRAGRAGLRRRLVAGGAPGRGPDHPQRVLARPAPSRARPARRRDVDAGAAADGRLRRHGLPADVDLRPVSARTRPAFGEHVAWAESNAIVFANSVLGARTEPIRRLHRHLRGDHRACAGSGTASRRGPARRASCSGWRTTCPTALLRDEITPTASGTSWAGAAGSDVPVIVGLPRHDRGRAEGARRGRGVVGRGGDVPRGGDHAGGAHARGGVSAGARRSARSIVTRDRLRAAAGRADDRRGRPDRRRKRRHAALLGGRVRALGALLVGSTRPRCRST